MKKEKADAVITAYLEKIYGFAVKKSFSWAEAEELASDIVEEVYTSLLRRDEIYNVEGYIWRISEHAWAKYVSQKKKRVGVSLDGMEIPYEEDFLPENAENELMKLRLAIAYLTENRRRAVYLFYYENRSVRDIARALAMPEGTVKWHLNKARKELKEAYQMERKIGKLGINPVKAISFGHNGDPGSNRGPEDYLGDRLDLNIVYSCYFTPRTVEGIADELGVTPAFLAERVATLEGNGFLVREKGDRFTTYVRFSPLTYSVERIDKLREKQLEAAAVLADEYRPIARDAVSGLGEVYLPTDNRELLERTVLLHKLTGACIKGVERDLSRYHIQTTAGGDFIAYIDLESTRTDPDYDPKNPQKNYWYCGTMDRGSGKYPVSSWSHDTYYTTRAGTWENNLTSDYEALYEFLTDQLPDTPANAEKRKRLRDRGFVDDSGKVCVMVALNEVKDEIERIPSVSEDILRRFADAALEYAMTEARDYPPQMQDLIVCENMYSFLGPTVALMACDLLYERGVWKPLTEAEKVAVDLMVFSDTLPAKD